MEAIRKLPYVIDCEYRSEKIKIHMENQHERLINILKILRLHNIEIAEISTNEPSLEDIYNHTIEVGGAEVCF